MLIILLISFTKQIATILKEGNQDGGRLVGPFVVIETTLIPSAIRISTWNLKTHSQPGSFAAIYFCFEMVLLQSNAEIKLIKLLDSPGNH